MQSLSTLPNTTQNSNRTNLGEEIDSHTCMSQVSSAHIITNFQLNPELDMYMPLLIKSMTSVGACLPCGSWCGHQGGRLQQWHGSLDKSPNQLPHSTLLSQPKTQFYRAGPHRFYSYNQSMCSAYLAGHVCHIAFLGCGSTVRTQ